MNKLIFVKILMYAIIAAVLSTAGVHGRSDWQFWAVLISIGVIDIISGTVKR